ncbi:1-phosphofructokinase [Paraclostridium ghonii]|uniref:1-phosphofructokinase n=1 Tax=Paraclostridium ghonii TaxID=29358 RepID=UPI00202CAF8A|nr:1-phosphofructokinase [Paeniclostridium ghonii]MCM0166277.1 1-phosphofructokinase [Paeniclostridium ghonii]
MITVITFNPSIDRLYKLERFEIGSVQRANLVNPTAGGKGLNVAKVLKKLGEDINCIGFLGGFNGEYIKSQLKSIGIENKFTDIKEETRICLNIIDSNNISTEILEKGPNVSEEEIVKFENDLEEILKDTEVLVGSGSLSRGLPVDYYLKIGNICNQKNIKFILDTSGESLKLGIKSSPYLIKPNMDELEFLSGIKIKTIYDIINISKKILLTGVKNVCVSMGKDGMILVNKDFVYKVEIPKIDVVNTVGSGDSSIAGFALGIERKYDLKETLKLANACGMSNAMHISTGDINLEDIEKFIDQINVYEHNCNNIQI